MADFEQLKTVTGVVRIAWANIWEPRAPHKDRPAEPGKYDLCAIVDKTDIATLRSIKSIVDILKQEALVKYNGKLPASFKFPLKDGDTTKDDDPNFEGKIYFNCSSKRKPGIIDANGNEITAINKDKVYSGCYCRLAINLFSYDAGGGKGIGVGIQHIMFVKDGEKLLSEGEDAASAFGIIRNPNAAASVGGGDDPDNFLD